MKKLKSIFCFLCLALASSLAFGSGKSDGAKDFKIGVLSFLNMSEEQLTRLAEGRSRAYALLKQRGYLKVHAKGTEKAPIYTYHDTLDSLILALKAGEINAIDGLPQSTAKYLCAKDASLTLGFEFDFSKTEKDNPFVSDALEKFSDGFSFMMLEKNSALCNQFNEVIAQMKEDGSLEKLVASQITGALDGQELKAVLPEHKLGRPTVRVAVTGALPPMDYVATDGSFAGFNTALLAEIGKRLDKNISIVQVSSIGRASALASGTVDVVFWTRCSPAATDSDSLSDKEYEEQLQQRKTLFSDEERDAMDYFDDSLKGDKDLDALQILKKRDIPDGCVITNPYFVDFPVPVELKSNQNARLN